MAQVGEDEGPPVRTQRVASDDESQDTASEDTRDALHGESEMMLDTTSDPAAAANGAGFLLTSRGALRCMRCRTCLNRSLKKRCLMLPGGDGAAAAHLAKAAGSRQQETGGDRGRSRTGACVVWERRGDPVSSAVAPNNWHTKDGGDKSSSLEPSTPPTVTVFGAPALDHTSDLIDAILAPGASLCAPSQRGNLGGERGAGDLVRVATSVMVAITRKRPFVERAAPAPAPAALAAALPTSGGKDKRRAIRCGTCHTCLNRQLKKRCLMYKDGYPEGGNDDARVVAAGAVASALGRDDDDDFNASEDRASPTLPLPVSDPALIYKPVMEGMVMPKSKIAKLAPVQHSEATSAGGTSTMTITTEGGITLTQYICQEPECGKVFYSSAQLKKHSLVHGVRPYKCIYPDCGKRFVDSSKLKRHWASHTGVADRQEVCAYPECGQAFHTAVQLRHHAMNGHMDERYYFCPYPNCLKRFTVREKLVEHVNGIHAAEVAADAASMSTGGGRVDTGGADGGGGGPRAVEGDDFDADTESE